MVEGAALLLSDLGVTRAVLSTAWFRGELGLQPRPSLHSIFPPFASLVCRVPPLSSGRGLGVWWRPNTPHARPVMRDRAIRRQCRPKGPAFSFLNYHGL